MDILFGDIGTYGDHLHPLRYLLPRLHSNVVLRPSSILNTTAKPTSQTAFTPIPQRTAHVSFITDNTLDFSLAGLGDDTSNSWREFTCINNIVRCETACSDVVVSILMA